MYLNILLHFVIGNESMLRNKEMEIIDEQQGQSKNTPSRRENKQMLPNFLPPSEESQPAKGKLLSPNTTTNR